MNISWNKWRGKGWKFASSINGLAILIGGTQKCRSSLLRLIISNSNKGQFFHLWKHFPIRCFALVRQQNPSIWASNHLGSANHCKLQYYFICNYFKALCNCCICYSAFVTFLNFFSYVPFVPRQTDQFCAVRTYVGNVGCSALFASQSKTAMKYTYFISVSSSLRKEGEASRSTKNGEIQTGGTTGIKRLHFKALNLSCTRPTVSKKGKAGIGLNNVDDQKTRNNWKMCVQILPQSETWAHIFVPNLNLCAHFCPETNLKKCLSD